MTFLNLYMKKSYYLNIIICANNLLLITISLILFLITDARNGEVFSRESTFSFFMLLGGCFLEGEHFHRGGCFSEETQYINILQ